MTEKEILLQVNGVELAGELKFPERARGLVIFAHGSGSSRHSPRNQYVARVLRQTGLGTLLIDLLTEEEEEAEAQTRHLRFDIPLLARRLAGATRWILAGARAGNKPLGYFGSSTGAAAALVAAAEMGEVIFAIVSRGGRPDLAGAALKRVKAPTLLLVGGEDGPVIQLNEEAAGLMTCDREIVIIPGASHLFEEPGKLEKVAALAAEWFLKKAADRARSED